MNIFKNRPLLMGCAIFLLTLVISYILPPYFCFVIISFSLIFYFTVFVIYKKSKKEKYLSLLIKITATCLLLFICASVSLLTFKKDEKIKEQYADMDTVLTVVIDEEIYKTDFESLYIAKVEAEESFKILLFLNDGKSSIGDKIIAPLHLRDLSSENIGYNEADFYLDQGVLLAAEAEDGYTFISQGNYSFKHFFAGINSKLDKIVKETLNEESGVLVSAMLLGNKGALGNDVKRDFSYLGISHVLALSGMHLSLITALFSAFLNIFKLDKRFKCFLLILMITGFVAITGFSESAIRSGVMMIIFYLLYYLGMRSDTLSSLFLAVTLICIFSPYSIFSVGLTLSFFAMIACIASTYFTKRQRRIRIYRIRPKFLRSVIYTFITSVFVMIFTLPIIFLKFNYVSIVSLLSNVFIVPLITLVLYVSPFVLLFAKIPYLNDAVKFVCEFLTDIIYLITSNTAKIPNLTVAFSNAFHTVGVILIAVSAILMLVLPLKRSKYAFSVLALGVLIFLFETLTSSVMRENEVAITAYNYKNADIVSVESNNKLMIIEASKPSKNTSNQSYFYQGYLGYTKIDTYVLCDYSIYICEALDTVTEKAFIENIMIPEPTSESEEYYSDIIERICAEKNISFSYIGNMIEFEDAKIYFMDKELLSSSKRCVSYRIEANGSVCTYAGSGNRSVLNYFISDSIEISDIVIFGSYGPSNKVTYSYETITLDYCVYLGNSREFSEMSISEEQIMPMMHKFIFK